MPTMNTQPPSELYVFLSFAGADRDKAKTVAAFLAANQIRFFADWLIPSGVNWDDAIEQALNECNRMALLLSTASMFERDEAQREWFRFVRKGKTIHPLMIEDCELHSRFDRINYIDARADFDNALERLLADLKSLPPPEVADPVTIYRRERIAE